MIDKSHAEFKQSSTVKAGESLFNEKKTEFYQFQDRVRKILDSGSKEKSPDFLQIEKVVKDNIIRIHKEVGVELHAEDFPPVYLLTKENAPDVFKTAGIEANSDMSGGYSAKAHAVVILENDLFMNAHALHHELMHSIGKKVISPFADSPDDDQGWNLITQRGFQTRNQRGVTLEEAACEFPSVKFALENTDSLMVKARKEAAKNFLESVGVDATELSEKLILYTVDSVIMLTVAPHYKSISSLVKRLVTDLGPQFMPLLLKTRVEPDSMRQLTSLIDGKYGKGTLSYILETPFDESNVANLVKKLYQMIPREPLKAVVTGI